MNKIFQRHKVRKYCWILSPNGRRSCKLKELEYIQGGIKSGMKSVVLT